MDTLTELNTRCKELFNAMLACGIHSHEYAEAQELWLSAENDLRQAMEAYGQRIESETDRGT